MKIGNRTIDLSHPGKMLFPEMGVTKNDVLDYYTYIAELMLPHLKNRPLMLQRFPDGVDKKGFYQKEASDYFPDWIPTTEVKKEDGTVNHVLCNNKETMAYLSNQATVSYHTWLSTAPKIENPDKFIIDLDPPTDDFQIVRDAAFCVRELLEKMAIISFIMTTGSSGIHIIVPLTANTTFEMTRKFGQNIGDILIERHSDIFTLERRIENRKGRLYFDIQRNAYAQTAIAPYSLRPSKNAGIATPLDWSELKNSSLHAKSYHFKNIKQRLSKKDNPWQKMERYTIDLKKAHEKLLTLL